jgi:hypothetical protein
MITRPAEPRRAISPEVHMVYIHSPEEYHRKTNEAARLLRSASTMTERHRIAQAIENAQKAVEILLSTISKDDCDA